VIISFLKYLSFLASFIKLNCYGCSVDCTDYSLFMSKSEMLRNLKYISMFFVLCFVKVLLCPVMYMCDIGVGVGVRVLWSCRK
jgi:hypothetical protein